MKYTSNIFVCGAEQCVTHPITWEVKARASGVEVQTNCMGLSQNQKVTLVHILKGIVDMSQSELLCFLHKPA